MDGSLTDIGGSALVPWALSSMLRARDPGGHPGPRAGLEIVPSTLGDGECG